MGSGEAKLELSFIFVGWRIGSVVFAISQGWTGKERWGMKKGLAIFLCGVW